MTVYEAELKLFNYFSKKDSFSFAENFSEVIPISENEALDKAVIQLALNQYIYHDLLKQLGDYYILLKPLNQISQNVSLSFNTISSIVNIIETYAESHNVKGLSANPLSIQEKDIQTILGILINS